MVRFILHICKALVRVILLIKRLYDFTVESSILIPLYFAFFSSEIQTECFPHLILDTHQILFLISPLNLLTASFSCPLTTSPDYSR